MDIFKKITKLKNALKLSNRKSLLVIFYEYLKYKLTKPELAEQYFDKFLFRQSTADPFNYIVTHKVAEQVWYYKDTNYNSVLKNKHISELFFSKFNIPFVRSFAYNINHLFFRNNELTMTNNSEEFRHFLINLKNIGYWKENSMIVKKKMILMVGEIYLKYSLKKLKTTTLL